MMKRLFVHSDGRLKTGMVSVCAFLLVFGLADAAFEIKKRSQSEVVKVRHVFDETREEVETVPPPVADEVQPTEPVVEPVSEVVVEVPPQETEVVPSVVPEVEMAQKESLPPEVPQEETSTPEPVVTAEQPPAPPVPEVQETVTSQAEVAEETPSMQEQLAILLGEPEEPPPVVTGGRDFEISEELRDLARPENTSSTPPPPSAEDTFLSSVPPSDDQKSEPQHFNGTVVSESEVRIDSKEYNEIFKSWRNAGTENDGAKQLSFRVQNLRKNYQLLQMKPVVVRSNRYFDLLSGAPLLAEFLEEYSSLQLVVEKPWQEWQPELKKLGLHVTDEFSVRYLLYGFIDRAMQHRVNQSFDCTVQQGLIPSGALPADVEIIGRVFQISRNGGGRFGVFVPQTLNLKGAQQVTIPVGQCFGKSSDVQMLMAAGVLH